MTEPTLDATSITGKATWPTLTAQTAQALSADAALLRFCKENDCWAAADQSWKSSFVAQGSVLCRKGTEDFVLVVGCVGHVAVLVCPLAVETTRTKETVFSLAPFTPKDLDTIQWAVVLEFDDWELVPTKPISPARLFICRGRRLQPNAGLRLRKTGPETTIQRHAALACFWSLGKQPLTKLADEEYGLKDYGPLLVDVVKALLKKILPELEDDALASILKLRCVDTSNNLLKDIPAEVFEDVLGESASAEIKDMMWVCSGRLCIARTSYPVRIVRFICSERGLGKCDLFFHPFHGHVASSCLSCCKAVSFFTYRSPFGAFLCESAFAATRLVSAFLCESFPPSRVIVRVCDFTCSPRPTHTASLYCSSQQDLRAHRSPAPGTSLHSTFLAHSCTAFFFLRPDPRTIRKNSRWARWRRRTSASSWQRPLATRPLQAGRRRLRLPSSTSQSARPGSRPSLACASGTSGKQIA